MTKFFLSHISSYISSSFTEDLEAQNHRWEVLVPKVTASSGSSGHLPLLGVD